MIILSNLIKNATNLCGSSQMGTA